MSSRDFWDERYAGADLVWSLGPNIWVEEIAAPLPPGRAVDLAAGEGRNALWLAERGWDVTAVDFSAVALERARTLAEPRLSSASGSLTTQTADLLEWTPDGAYDLVLVVYVQVPAEQRAPIMRAAAAAVGAGGRLVVVAHHGDNLGLGVGGPQDPSVLYTADDVIEDVSGSGLRVERAERGLRQVETEQGTRDAIDTVAVLVRPTA